MDGFYLLHKSVMKKFEHWDIVVSTNNEWLQVEAVVDFQDWNKLYISERGKNLNNPVRYIIDSDNIYKKEKGKLTLTLSEMNSIMAMTLWLSWANYNKEPKIEDMQVWQSLKDVNNSSRTFTYVWMLDGEPVWQCDWYFCVIDESELKKMLWSKEDVCKRLFGLTPDDINILDD